MTLEMGKVTPSVNPPKTHFTVLLWVNLGPVRGPVSVWLLAVLREVGRKVKERRARGQRDKAWRKREVASSQGTLFPKGYELSLRLAGE